MYKFIINSKNPILSRAQAGRNTGASWARVPPESHLHNFDHLKCHLQHFGEICRICAIWNRFAQIVAIMHGQDFLYHSCSPKKLPICVLMSHRKLARLFPSSLGMPIASTSSQVHGESANLQWMELKRCQALMRDA